MARAGQQWSAFHYDGRTARRDQVTVTVASDGLRFRREDGSDVHWPFEGLRQTQGSFVAERLRIEFGTDPVEVLAIHQDGLPEAINAVAPGVVRRLRPRRHAARVAAWSVGILATAAAAYVWGVPRIADWLAPRVPVEWEARLGRSAIERIAVPGRRCDDPIVLSNLRQINERLIAALPASEYDFQLFVMRDAQVNAFAAPGGFIVVNSGLLTAAASPEEVAGVLAHEIQHVVQRHSTRGVIREVPLRLALAVLSGGSGVETAAAALGTLGSLKHRRGDEAEADREGMRLLAAADIDPRAMVSFMRTLDAEPGGGSRLVSYLSSHPHTTDRIAALEAMVPASGGKSRPLLDAAAWERVKGGCDAG